MSDDALIEAMARAIEVAACENSDDVYDWTNEAEAALDVARPIIEAPLRAENEKLRAAKSETRKVYDAFVASLGCDDLGEVAVEILRLRAENEKLRAEIDAIKSPPDYGTQKIMNEQIHYAGLIAQKDREIERLRAENEKLRAALKPFAEQAALYDDGAEDHWEDDRIGKVKVADLRAARAAYLGEKHDNE